MEKVTVKMYWNEEQLPVIYPNSQPGYWDEETEQYLLTYPGEEVSLFSSRFYDGSIGGNANARITLTTLYKACLTGVFEGDDAYYYLVKKEGKNFPLPLYWNEIDETAKKSIISALEVALTFDDEALHEFLEKN